MKKVLIIGHFWPYRGRGSVRMLGLVKYLPEFGWEPIILTGPLKDRPNPNFRFIETDYLGFLGSWIKFLGINQKNDIGDQLKVKFDRKPSKSKYFLKFFYNLLKEIFAYPDEDKNWKKFALRAAEDLLKKEKIDVMISIYPETSHLIAKELKIKYKIPWIVDFPDLWSQNYYYPYTFVRKFFDRRLEIKTIKSADALTVVCGFFIEKLKTIHKNKANHVILHGFDPEEINEPVADLTNKFTITYTGQIYIGKQDPLKLFIALRELISDGTINPKDVEVRFYGPKNDWLENKIKNYKLSNIIKQYGAIPRNEVIKKQRRSQVLYFLKWEDEQSKGVYTGKIFEYLAAQRPILATGGSKDVVTDLLIETRAGSEAFDIKNIESCLKRLYGEYKQKGKVSYNGDREAINKYNHREMAKKFADVLDEITYDEKRS